MLTVENILYAICHSLQLTHEQYTSAEDKYKKICQQLRADKSPFHDYDMEIFPQGSFAIQTTVKPLTRDEYDIDLICLLQNGANSLIDPMKLLTDLKSFLAKIYGNENVELKKRCVCINFSKSFHLDILPAIPDIQKGGTNLLIPDREIKQWTSTNPQGYKKWFLEQCQRRALFASKDEALPPKPSAWTQTPLQNTVQLFKRWRDIAFQGNNEDWIPRSIVLTTLLANVYLGDISITNTFSKTLQHIKQKVDQQKYPLVVNNPLDPKECFSEKWHEVPEGYFHFRTKISTLWREWDNLLNASSLTEQQRVLSNLFGENVTKVAISTVAKQFASPRVADKLRVTSAGVLTLQQETDSISVPKHTFYGD